MNHLLLRTISTKTNTWCYRQGFYRYKKIKNKGNDQYAPLICKFIDIPVVNEEFAKKYCAKWDEEEEKWVIMKEFKKFTPVFKKNDL